MSGAEVKTQVMEALWDTTNALVPGTLEFSRAEAAADLSDCVVLTKAEAEWLAISLPVEADKERQVLGVG